MKNNLRKRILKLAAGTLCITFLTACSSGQAESPAESSASKNTASASDAEEILPETDTNMVIPEAGSDTPVTSVGTFTAQDINGETYTQDMFKDYDLTMVNLFTTWCSPCVAEIPDLDRLRQNMADQGVNVVGVVLDTVDENAEVLPDVLEQAKLLAQKTEASYPFLIPDSTWMNGRLRGIMAFPETFFVDQDGNIVGDTYSGSNSLEGWTEIVEKELENLKEGA